MRNTVLSIIQLIWMFAAISSSAQNVFWSEDFGTGCAQGTLADNYATTNGTWTVTPTGTNANYANSWYISSTEAGMGVNNCGDGCINNPNLINRTLHIGNIAINIFSIPADQGAAYYSSSTICNSNNICGATQKRVESPIINCTGMNGITLRFLYMENGGATAHNATVWYSNDGGANWIQIYDPPKTSLSCNPQGLWTLDSVALPSSADNNPNVKIGFEWYNDDNDNAADPSFAIDDIELYVPSSGPAPVADFIASDTNICENDCIYFTDMSANSPTSWSWSFPGGNPGTSTLQNPDSICYSTAGSYDVTLIVDNGNGSDTLTLSNYITVNVCTGIEDASNLRPWKLYPNPAENAIRINFIPGSDFSPCTLVLYNQLGEKIHARYTMDARQIIVYRNELPSGLYVFQLISHEGKTMSGKFCFR